MILPVNTNAYILGDYEFTACCGDRVSSDKVACNKCGKKVDRIYSKGEEYDFADKIWYHSDRTRFVVHPDAKNNNGKGE